MASGRVRQSGSTQKAKWTSNSSSWLKRSGCRLAGWTAGAMIHVQHECLLSTCKTVFPPLWWLCLTNNIHLRLFSLSKINSKCSALGLYTVAHDSNAKWFPALWHKAVNFLLNIPCLKRATRRNSAPRIAAHKPVWRLVCAQSASTCQYFSIDLLH